jgi:ABC-type Co2+ transport system, periplasmic component
MRKVLLSVLSGTLIGLISQSVTAHGIWIANRVDQKQIVLGEGPLDNGYHPESVKQVKAYNGDWSVLPVSKKVHNNFVTIETTNETAVVTVDFDYGYWTKNSEGKYVNLPMNEVKGANNGTHAIKYSVNYLSSVKQPKMIQDIPLQIVPSVDPTKLKRGDSLPITVYKDGKPLTNTAVIVDVVNNLDKTVKTDDKGQATIIVPNQGLNVIGVEIGFPLKDNQLATQDKFFTTLVFTLIPEED